MAPTVGQPFSSKISSRIGIATVTFVVIALTWSASAYFDHAILGKGTFVTCLYRADSGTMAVRIFATAAILLSVISLTAYRDNRLNAETLGQLFKAANDAFMLVEVGTGKIIECNKRAGELLGYDRDELVHLTARDLHPFDHQQALTFFGAVVHDGHGVCDELQCRTKSGHNIPSEVSASLVVVRGKKMVLIGIRDISRRKAAEQAAAESIQLAERASRVKSELLSNVSHEFRTPLNAIIGFSESLLAGLAGPIATPQQRNYVSYISASGHALLALIDRVMDISAAENGEIHLDEEIIDLDAFCDYIKQAIEERARAHDIKFEMSCEPNLALRGEERRIRQILVNLLDNAIKFTVSGGHVTARIRETGDHAIEFSVKDTGIGIPAEWQERIFEPFVQVRSPFHSALVAGAGIGLALARSVARAHGGTISVESEPGHGATFTVRFPPERNAKVGSAPAPATARTASPSFT